MSGSNTAPDSYTPDPEDVANAKASEVRTRLGCTHCGGYRNISGMMMPCGRHWVCFGCLDEQGRRSKNNPAYEEWHDLKFRFLYFHVHVAEGCD